MKLSKLGIVYASLGAIVAVVACSSESESARDLGAQAARNEANGTESSGASVIDKEIDAGASTSDAAP